MKKLFSILCLCLMCTLMSAQVVETGNLKDNWYMTGNVGTTVWDNSRSWAKPSDILLNIGIGKEITPIFGLELDVTGGLNQGNYTSFDSHNITANVATNLSNLFLGYKGKRRVIEPILLVGAGWYHNYGNIYNNVSARGAVRVNFNLSKSIALNVTPEYLLIPKTTPLNHGLNVYVGITYRIKSENGNFPIMKLYDEAEVQDLNTSINELRARNNKLLATKPVEIRTTDTVTIVEILTPKIQFIKNSSVVSETSTTAIAELAAYISDLGKTFVVEGYASEEGTIEHNEKLSLARANSVKKALVEFGAPENMLVVKGCGATTDFGDQEFNRIVIITEQ